jgi:urate oxidase
VSYELAAHQYGKAETRLVRIYRDADQHEIRDLNVSTCLRGDFADAYLSGDQAAVLPTDSQKNTAYAFALERGVTDIETYALALATHFADEIEPVRGARVDVDEYRWQRVALADGAGHPHAFVRAGQEVRTASVTVEDRGPQQRVWVLSGLRDLVLLKSTGSEFAGFLHDRYTTLPETDDRVLATSLTASWRQLRPDGASDAQHASIRQVLIEQFATLHSLALQQSLFQMGKAVLAAHQEIAEIRLSAPNKHHFLVDLSPFGLANRGEVFHADDRPYGLIQCAVQRDDAPPAGPAWQVPGSFAG